MRKYFKNYILFGNVECHCLLCKETFQAHELVEKHIRWDKHRANEKSQTYLPKLKKDFISKIDNYYYCDICNYCTKYYKIIIDHIGSEFHKTNKQYPDKVHKNSIGKYQLDNVVIQNTIIPKTSWNCIIGEKCFVCYIHVHDIANHIESQDHVINLIQTEIKCEKGQYYRQELDTLQYDLSAASSLCFMVNDHFFQCFICNAVFTSYYFNEHWTSQSHPVIPNKSETTSDDEFKLILEAAYTCSEALIVGIGNQRKYFKLNASKPKATCRICKQRVLVELEILVAHLQQQHNYNICGLDIMYDNNMQLKRRRIEPSMDAIFRDHGKIRSELAFYGNDNYITLSEGGKKAYCWLCDISIVPMIDLFRQHIKGLYHQSHLKFKYISYAEKIVKEQPHPITSYMEYIRNVNYSNDLSCFVINNEYCVNKLSFMFLFQINFNPRKKQVKCHVCPCFLLPQEIFNHCATEKHSEGFISSKVLDIKDEFIREVAPKKYHCGTCNLVFSFFATLEKHLKSRKHLIKKSNLNAAVCFDNFHKKKGRKPAVEQLPLTSNIKVMYCNYMNFATINSK